MLVLGNLKSHSLTASENSDLPFVCILCRKISQIILSGIVYIYNFNVIYIGYRKNIAPHNGQIEKKKTKRKPRKTFKFNYGKWMEMIKHKII